MGKLLTLLILISAANPVSAIEPEEYDQQLCQTAQRWLINDEQQKATYILQEQRGASNGFHTIQMGTEAEPPRIVIASYYQQDDDGTIVAASCKLINRERANTTLGLSLTGPDRQCRDINQHTYQRALSQLTGMERKQYLEQGIQLQFVDDYIATTGGEWLPIDVQRENQLDQANKTLRVKAPSVQVAWNPQQRKFFQGVHHCKLISLQTMLHWMREQSFSDSAQLINDNRESCTAANQTEQNAGSCLFYFAPADTIFCKDYTGPDWSKTSVMQECSKRHASKAALTAAKNRYEGNGGIYAPSRCAERDDIDNIHSSCVFNCQAADEAIWHSTEVINNSAGAAMMNKACDLYILHN